MHLTLNIDLDQLPAPTAREAARILRYWAGALAQLDLTAEASHQLTDSAYQPVGELRLTGSA